jgi:carboxyl-terminal processing protease
MKLKYLFAILLVSVLFIFGSTTPQKDFKKQRIILELLNASLNQAHFDPPQIDDEFSKKAYKLYVERIDFNKLFLIQEDIDQLSKFETLIDDEIKNGTFRFYDLSVEIVEERTKEVEDFYKDILSKPFDFNIDEDYQSDADKYDYAENLDELKEMWRKSLKYQVLSRVYTKMKQQEKALENNDTSVVQKSFEELEVKARESVMKSHDEWFRRLSQVENADRFNVFANSIVGVYDPHTEYFPPKDKENFDIRMSGQLEGIGATLSEKEGYIKVERIVPGSASWKQGELEAGDLILKVAQGEEEPVDIVDMRLDKAVQLIRGPKGTEVRLTVKKIDGSIVVIPIIRDVVIIDETYARSIKVENTEADVNAAYILLPSFYADFNNRGGRNSADDIKAELKKIKQEDYDGVILDLRNNGGGSLMDVVKIVGMFIDNGPVVQVKARGQSPMVHKDYNRGIYYDGPVVILVNSLSASASEILAAALQDYGRAVIVGSNSFGKGTVQRFLELDGLLRMEDEAMKPLGALKLTIQKFYRINGDATQLKGVTPDVILPDDYMYLEIGEREMDYPMPFSEIDAVSYENYSKNIEIQEIAKQSEKRVKNTEVFQMVEENAKRLKDESENSVISLNYEKYKESQEKKAEKAKKYKKLYKPIDAMNTDILLGDKESLEADTSKAVRFEAWQKEVKKDPYVFEATNIIKDLEGYFKEEKE